MTDYSFRPLSSGQMLEQETKMFIPDGSYIGTVTDIQEKQSKQGYTYYQIKWDLESIMEGEHATGWQSSKKQYINDFLSPENPAATEISMERLSKMAQVMLGVQDGERDVHITEFLHKEARLVIRNKQDKSTGRFWPRITDFSKKPSYTVSSEEIKTSQMNHSDTPHVDPFDGDEIPF